MQLAPNLVIAERFRLNRQLGRGGMGSVWHATHLGLDIPCAVKFIEGEFAQIPEAQARFEREAKAAAQLRSPHVVQILDHGVWQGTPYIAMELLDGEDLGKRILRVGRLPAQQLIPIITQVSRALTKAHTAGIVHRDLKPDNIFLVRDDDREIAKVLDFGIAKANSNAIDGSNTKTGAMLGTPYYMSPEQAQGTKSVDFRADLWSLAVICFQCVTGRLPFESEALGDLLVKIIVSPIPVPSQVAPDVPMAFDKWWAKAASRDPAQRFQSAKELADSLGLVFGLSQMTDVMDRNQMRAAMQSHEQINATGGTVALPMVTPPGFQQTPQPQQQGGIVVGGGPMANTPHPMHQSGGAYGAPNGRTFGGSEIAAGVPPKKSGLGLILAGVGAFVVIGVIAIVAVVMVGRGKGTQAAGGGEPTSGTAATTATATSTATTPPTSTAAQPTATATAATAEPTATTSAAPDTTAAPTTTVANVGPHALPTSTGNANNHPAPTPTGNAPNPTPTATHAQPAPTTTKDLGF